MKKTLIACLTFLMVLLAACAGTTPQAASEPAPATEAVTLPTEPAPATDAASATEAPSTQEAVSGVSFAKDIQPIFQASCIECHGVRQVKEGLDLQTYETAIAGSFNGPVIVPGNASESLLTQLVVEGEMPNRGPKLTAEQIQLISEWINQGAQNN